MMTEQKVLLNRQMSNLTILDTRPRLIIGLDFGTTWSGFVGLGYTYQYFRVSDSYSIAWGQASCPETTEKVPTLLAYRDSKLAWGHQVDNSGNRPDDTIEGVKLLLDEKQIYRFKPASNSKRIIQKMNQTPVDVVADYLERLVAHSMEVLNRRFSTALQTMELQAAHLANIPASALTLLSEPEAAAVYAIQTIQPNSIKMNDCLVVCDAGGGTVDIITYQITQTEPLRFSEVTEGTGAVCGSVMLDVRFEELLQRIYKDDYSREIPQGALNCARRYWQDYIKPTYRGSLDEKEFEETPYRIPLPGAAVSSGAHGFDGGFWYMEHEQVKGIFDPIVKQIEELLADQWVRVREENLSIKAIILVEGLGSSEYLYRCLRTTFDGIEVMQPKNAWSAVVRYDRCLVYFNAPSANGNSGAVHCGQEENQVDHRMARCNYGVKHSRKVGDNKNNTNISWCPYEEAWYHDGLMKWYITKVRIATLKGPIFFHTGRDSLAFYKGMPLSSNELISFAMYCTVPECRIHSPILFHEKLRFNQNPTAPETFDESTSTST
ncbi:unnamed protein product [Penicillium salamii]|uniref:Uncharacterized protein n=1 Tax=Penicillium salamii TaxID=1612424 RepID=A0A9W4IGT8_9EURO|nr:unnamed protein product [Penicillium salamii]